MNSITVPTPASSPVKAAFCLRVDIFCVLASPHLKYCDDTLLFIFIFRLFQAVQKIRNYVMEKIYQFRRPMTNYQIPQNALLKYRYSKYCCVLRVFQFLQFLWLFDVGVLVVRCVSIFGSF